MLLVATALLSFGPLQLSPRRILSEKLTCEDFDLRFRPGSRAGATADFTAHQIERALAEIEAELLLEFPDRFEVFVYDSTQELGRIHGLEGIGGFASGLELHIPHDNLQTLRHELVHVVAQAIPRVGEQERSLFFQEGLANALLVYTHGLHAHTAAAFELKRGQMPALGLLLGEDFYGWLQQHPDFFGYDVAASWMLFLKERFGMPNLKRYFGGLSELEAFGLEQVQLEEDWHALLDQVVLRPETLRLLQERGGGPQADFAPYAVDPDSRLPAELRSTASGWQAVARDDQAARTANARLEPLEDGLRLERLGGPDWAEAHLDTASFGDGALRLIVEVVEGSCASLAIGPGCQAQLVGNGAFLFDGEGYVALDHDLALAGAGEFELLLRRRAGQAQLWVEGYLILEGPVAADPGPLVLGVAGQSASFRALAWKP